MSFFRGPSQVVRSLWSSEDRGIVDAVSMFQISGVYGKPVWMCDYADRRKSGSRVRIKTASLVNAVRELCMSAKAKA